MKCRFNPLCIYHLKLYSVMKMDGTNKLSTVLANKSKATAPWNAHHLCCKDLRNLNLQDCTNWFQLHIVEYCEWESVLKTFPWVWISFYCWEGVSQGMNILSKDMAIVAQNAVSCISKIDIWQVQAKTNCTLCELLLCSLELYKSQWHCWSQGVAKTK